MTERSDARRNRSRIVAAAARVFREQGVTVPLDVVARTAEVGRGTLYRHFPDRAALLAAVLEERVDMLERFAAEHEGDDLLERLVVEICWYQADVPGLLTALSTSDGVQARLGGVVDRTTAMLRAAHERALRAKALRPGTSLDDVLLATAMLGGVVTAGLPMPHGVERALELLLRGLRPEDRAALPVPVAELR